MEKVYSEKYFFSNENIQIELYHVAKIRQVVQPSRLVIHQESCLSLPRHKHILLKQLDLRRT